MKTPMSLFLFVLSAMLTVACGEREQTDAEPRLEEPMMTEHAPELDMEESVVAARSQMAEQLGIEVEEIEVVEAERVTWGNGALGCPEPGMMYTQALVEGYYIRLRSGDQERAYHAGRDGQPFYCPAERSQKPQPNGARPRY